MDSVRRIARSRKGWTTKTDETEDRLFVRLSNFLQASGPEWANGSSIWNSRSKLSRWSVLEIDVMSARTGQDTGPYYARGHVSQTSPSFPTLEFVNSYRGTCLLSSRSECKLCTSNLSVYCTSQIFRLLSTISCFFYDVALSLSPFLFANRHSLLRTICVHSCH